MLFKSCEKLTDLLGGSWHLVSRVIGTLIGVISRYNYGYRTYNPLTKSPDPLSNGCRLKPSKLLNLSQNQTLKPQSPSPGVYEYQVPDMGGRFWIISGVLIPSTGIDAACCGSFQLR